MFRKKPTQNAGRNVRHAPSANVFSYYASRSAPETVGRNVRRSGEPKNIWAARIKYLPSFVAIITLAVCLVYVSTLSTKPQIQVVNAQDSQLLRGTDTYEKEAQTVLVRSVFNRSKLLIDTNKVAREVQKAFPELGQVSVVLPLMSRRPIVEVRPARPALLLSAPGGVFVIDEEGRAIANASEVGSSLRDSLPAVQDDSGLPLERGKTVLPKEIVVFITTVSHQLVAKQIVVQSLTLPAVANELHIRLDGKPYVAKFDIRGEGREQVGTFLAVKARLEKENKTPSEYIDVRVPEKAFYK